jgi:hypothetical protein
MVPRRLISLIATAVSASALLASPALAQHAAMVPDGFRTVEGHGRFVEIPGFPGKKIDRRLLPDVAWLVRRYHVSVTSAYSLSKVHDQKGEHPRGLAVDLVPDAGGSWGDLARLARWAEPDADIPRAPFKWVGWNGDRGHGDPSHCKLRKGCFPHLHLSWQHGDTPRARPAPWVDVLRFRRVTLAD